MISVTKNNYYTPVGSQQTFSVDISPASRRPNSYGEELILNAKEIWESRGTDKIYAMYSGGIDSELLIEVFLSQNMEIIPVIVRLLPNYNAHDLAYAYSYCERKKLTPVVIDIDMDDFINSGKILEVSNIVGPTAYQILPIIYTAMSLDGIVLTGSNEPYFKPDDNNIWSYIEKEYLCVWTRMYNAGKLTGTPSFHSWTPETLLAFSIDPQITQLCNNLLPGKKGTFSSRGEVYNRMFPMPPRPKYTGWEMLENSELFEHENLKSIIEFQKTGAGIYKLEYHTLLNILTNEI